MNKTKSYNPLILITGATCSGKSSLAVEVAKAVNGEVISIDSVQVYKDFDIGSAKITESEMQNVPHHLLSIWNPEEKFDVAKYIEIAKSKIKEIQSKGKCVVIAGGSMMYVTILLCGLAKIPKTSASIREEVENLSTNEAFNLLKEYDSKKADALNPNDTTRIKRALEVVLSSKKSIDDFQKKHNYSNVDFDVIGYVICKKREDLYKNINQRTKEMVEGGLIEEVKSLKEKYENTSAPFSSIGYKETLLYLDNKISKEELIEEIAKNTRHFSKRQMTYLRNEPIKRAWNIAPREDIKEDKKKKMLLSSDSSTICGKGVIKDFYVYNYKIEDLIKDIREKFQKEEKGIFLEYINLI